MGCNHNQYKSGLLVYLTSNKHLTIKQLIHLNITQQAHTWCAHLTNVSQTI